MESIAHYRITAKLGEGGMGAVYRATDTKLNREVAVKILPDAFAADPDRLARFTREAHVLASLNHPNIAAIYGVEERALVLELVEGPTLTERIPMPLEDALPIARQIAEALEYAHEHGVVHRDLKPANIKLTADGRVKVLDFGLAKAMAGDSTHADPLSSPTLTMRATVAGAIMGTAAYMAPEQARGQAVDRRADIWAFGVVLYEMLSGRKLFAGPTVSDTLAAVLKTDVDLSAIPEAVRAVIERCLRRDPRARWQAIGDVRVALEEGPPAAAPAPASRRSLAPWLAAAALAIAAAAGTGWWRASRPAARPFQRFNVDLGPDALLSLTTTAAISPDGTRLAYLVHGPAGIQLAVRALDQPNAIPLPGTENASDPFFAPDGQWIGFFAGGKMLKIAARGGSPVTLCDAPAPRGASWGDDGNIVASLNNTSGLSRVPESGGAPVSLTKPAQSGHTTHRFPRVLPGSRTVLFTAANGFDFDNGSIEVLTLATGKWKTVLKGGYGGLYVPTGHLLYAHRETLFGVPFDAARIEVRGTPVPLLEKGAVASDNYFGAGQFDYSASGVFFCVTTGVRQLLSMMWLDAAGKTDLLIAEPGIYITPRFSPDGKRLAVNGFKAAPRDIWIYDWQRQTPQRLTFTGDDFFPVWTPDGKHIVYASQGAVLGLWWIRSDSAGETIKLYDGKGLVRPHAFTADGRRLVFSESGQGTSSDLWTLPLDLTDPEHPKAGAPEPFLRTPANETYPALSPDGRWMAYESNESGDEEIHVRPFPGPGGHWQVSIGGGKMPVWSPTGRELFYLGPDNRIMAVEYNARASSFDAGKPRAWSAHPLAGTAIVPVFDVAPDGRRIAAPPFDTGTSKNTVHVTFLINFFDELKRRLP
jgi:serine/threonine-protein kinase